VAGGLEHDGHHHRLQAWWGWGAAGGGGAFWGREGAPLPALPAAAGDRRRDRALDVALAHPCGTVVCHHPGSRRTGPTAAGGCSGRGATLVTWRYGMPSPMRPRRVRRTSWPPSRAASSSCWRQSSPWPSLLGGAAACCCAGGSALACVACEARHLGAAHGGRSGRRADGRRADSAPALLCSLAHSLLDGCIALKGCTPPHCSRRIAIWLISVPQAQSVAGYECKKSSACNSSAAAARRPGFATDGRRLVSSGALLRRRANTHSGVTKPWRTLGCKDRPRHISLTA
jgi:hypothetical protein